MYLRVGTVPIYNICSTVCGYVCETNGGIVCLLVIGCYSYIGVGTLPREKKKFLHDGCGIRYLAVTGSEVIKRSPSLAWPGGR